MAWQLLINGVDRTSIVNLKGFRKEDNLNERVDTLRFKIDKYIGQTYEPSVGQSVVLMNGATKEFAGILLRVDKSVEANDIVNIDCEAKDNSHLLDRKLVLERYTNATIGQIILAMTIKYAPSFTVNNVNSSFLVSSITFDRQPMSECIDMLARMVGYSWYVDYDKDIHFFPLNDEVAPFNITDDTGDPDFGKYVTDSLNVDYDFSQVRNRITIRGDEEEGNPRTESFDGDGVKLNFILANKFAQRPEVTVDGNPVTVGIDYLDQEADFDCFWSFQEKYIRFKPSTVPAVGTDNIEVLGIPLFPVIVTRSDNTSVAMYGVYEYFEENKQLKSRDDALEYAQGIILRDAHPRRSGSFQTYETGLRSGQVITVDSSLFGVTEQFIIQRVSLSLYTYDKPIYNVTIASLRDTGIVRVLQDLLRRRDVQEPSSEPILSFSSFLDQLTISDELVSISKTSAPYKWGSDPNEGRWNFSTWG